MIPIDLTFHGDPALAADVARRTEADGAGGLFVPEGNHDPFVTLTLAASSTNSIPLGTGIALAFARSPMQMAYSAYDLHRLSEGRFILGLGSQIRPHIERRYSMPWSKPAARMAEYIAALHAIWESWQTGAMLDFRGDFYSHTLMPPLFNPGPLTFASPQIWLAGVGPKMVETAGAVADGFICHPLLSPSYLKDVLVPGLERGQTSVGRTSSPTLSAMVMVASGQTEEELAVAIAGTRQQIGFYASTPAYRPVLDHHGWGELHMTAHAFTREGRWRELADLVDDEVLNTLAVVGEVPQVSAELQVRFGDLADRVVLSIPYPADDSLGRSIARGSSGTGDAPGSGTTSSTRTVTSS